MSSGDWIMFLGCGRLVTYQGPFRVLRGEFREGVAKAHFLLIRFHQGTGEDGGVFPKKSQQGRRHTANCGYRKTMFGRRTSGNVFRRDALIKVMPIPEPEFKICADTYLCLMVSAYGAIASVDRPLGYYCVHGENAYGRLAFRFERKYLASQALGHLRIARVAERVLLGKGIRPKRTELDRRENIEIVAIAARFGAIHLEEFDLSREKIFRHWAVSYHDTPKTIRSRFPAFVIWKIINHAPFAIVKVAMHLPASIRSRRSDRMYEQD